MYLLRCVGRHLLRNWTKRRTKINIRACPIMRYLSTYSVLRLMLLIHPDELLLLFFTYFNNKVPNIIIISRQRQRQHKTSKCTFFNILCISIIMHRRIVHARLCSRSSHVPDRVYSDILYYVY